MTHIGRIPLVRRRRRKPKPPMCTLCAGSLVFNTGQALLLGRACIQRGSAFYGFMAGAHALLAVISYMLMRLYDPDSDYDATNPYIVTKLLVLTIGSMAMFGASIITI